MLTADLDYHLDKELIAQTPVEPRQNARLLVVNRQTKQLTHHHIFDLPRLLQPTDLLVVNNTKVSRRQLTVTTTTGGHLGLTLLEPTETGWRCFVKGHLKVQRSVVLPGGQTALLGQPTADQPPVWQLSPAEPLTEQTLDKIAHVTLPPYVKTDIPEARYQTVFAKTAGSLAAPTAGLHFSPELLAELHARSITTAELTLHVGLGTFLPIRTTSLASHVMHSEAYDIPAATAQTVNQAKQSAHRVIAVGTTALRTLEASTGRTGHVTPGGSQTNLFITPGYQFKVADGLLTNFHLPKTTLLALVYAFGGRSLIRHAYSVAIEQRYRFYSFGDAMLII